MQNNMPTARRHASLRASPNSCVPTLGGFTHRAAVVLYVSRPKLCKKSAKHLLSSEFANETMFRSHHTATQHHAIIAGDNNLNKVMHAQVWGLLITLTISGRWHATTDRPHGPHGTILCTISHILATNEGRNENHITLGKVLSGSTAGRPLRARSVLPNGA